MLIFGSFRIYCPQDYLLWTEWGVNNPANSGIHAINKETGDFISQVPSDSDLYDIKAYDKVRQPDGEGRVNYV